MASSNRISASSGSEIQQFVRTVLNAVTNLQPRGGQSNEDSSTQQFPSVQHEISSRFNLPKGREESANFNPRQNYSSIRRPVQGVGNRRRRGNFRPVTSTATVQEPDYSIKDVCLIPSPDIDQVPRGNVKASLVESGLYVDAFEVDKAWSEVKLSSELASLFEHALKRPGQNAIQFEFVKSSGSKIVPIQVKRGQERNARVIKHISGQGPIYIRAMEALSTEENDESGGLVNEDGDDGLSSILDDDNHGLSSVLDNDHGLPSVLMSDVPQVRNPQPGRASSIVQAEPATDTREPDDNNRQTLRSQESQQSPPLEQQPESGLSVNNPSRLNITDCVDQLTMMFPDMSRVSLERTFQAWNYDMERTVTVVLGVQEGCLHNDEDDVIPLSVCKQSPEVAIKEFRERMIDKSVPSQLITASHTSSSVVRDMFQLLKCGRLNLKAEPNVTFSNEPGMDADGLTRELCHMVMANMRDGKGGIVLFEGNTDHLVPVHSEEYIASNYFKYAGQLIAHSVLHAGFGLTGLSRAISEYLVTEDINSCLPYLSEEDISDMEIRETLKQIQEAETEDQLNEVTSKDDVMVLLTQSGFTNEFVSVQNRHRACQCIMIHAVFKIRREELEQLREGLESISLITFLRVSASCMKYVFPLQSDVEVSKEDVLNLIDKHWVESLSGTQRTTVDWFLQYVNDVDEGNAETEMDPQFSSLPTLAQLVQFITGHPYLPSRGLDITFSLTAVYPDADACFSFLRLPTIHSNYQDFRNAMNTAITCQHRGYGRG